MTVLGSTRRLFWSILLGFGWQFAGLVAISVSSVVSTQVVMFCVNFFHQLPSRFFLCTRIQSSSLIRFLYHSRMRYCCLGHIHRLCCLVFPIQLCPHSFHHLECLFCLSLFCFCGRVRGRLLRKILEKNTVVFSAT